MYNGLKSNLKKLTALLLAVAMISGVDALCYVNEVYAEELQESVANDVESPVNESDEDTCALTDGESDTEIKGDEEAESELLTDNAADITPSVAKTEDEEIAGEVWTFKDPETINDEYLVYYLKSVFGMDPDAPYYSDAFRHIDNKDVNNDDAKEADFGMIEKSELEAIEELTISYGYLEKNEMNYWGYIDSETKFNKIQLGDLSKFTKLKTLTIEGHTNIKTLNLPASLKSLTIKNCTFAPNNSGTPNGLDVSQCSDLEYLEFTNNTFDGDKKDSGYYIHGLNSDVDENSVKALKYLKIDGSHVSKLALAVNGVTSPGLELSAVGCPKLTSIDCKGYRLVSGTKFANAPIIRNCANLTTVAVNGLANKQEQALTIYECDSLNSLSIFYYFDSADNIVNIDVNGIPNTSGTCTVGRLEGSAEGKYKISAIKTSFIYKDIEKKYSEYFDGIAASSYEAAFIVFEQDNDKFLKGEYWKVANRKNIRDYEKKPIRLYVGQSIDNNKVYLYTEEGIRISPASYDLEVVTITKPTENTDSTYNVISVDENNNNKVTALKPGMVEITITAKDNAKKTGKQRIIVCNPVTSLKVSDSKALYDKSGDYYFKSTMGTEYPSLIGDDDIRFTDGVVRWHIEKKSKGKWEVYTTYSNDGLKVYGSGGESNSRKTDESNINVLENGSSLITIEDKMVGGEYRVYGEVLDRKRYSANDSDTYKVFSNIAGNKDNEKYFEFNIINVGYTGSKLSYGMVGDYSGDGYVSEIYYEAPDIEGYTLDAEFKGIYDNAEKNTAYKQELSKYLKLVRVGDGNNKYKLSFDESKTSGEISDFLRSFGNNPQVKVLLTVKNGDYSKTYEKTVDLAGFFTVTYDLDGGVLQDSKRNYSYYAVPFSISSSRGVSIREIKYSPTKRGYYFDGWYTKGENGVKVTLLGEGAKGNLELVAKWRQAPVADNLTKNVYTYTGSAIIPEVIVHDGDVIKLKETDYSLVCKNNINVYTLTPYDDGFNSKKAPTVIITGKGNYTDNGGFYFTIQPKDIGDEDVTVGELSNALYTGRAIKPAPKMTFGNKTLGASDYNISYYRHGDNGVWINPSTGDVEIRSAAKAVDPKEPGKYYAKIDGKGNYKGAVIKAFEILPKSQEFVCTLESESRQYNAGNQIKPLPVVKYDGKELVKDKDYTLTYKNNVNAYTLTGEDAGFDPKKAPTITVKGKGIYTASYDIYFTIQPASITSEGFTVADIADVKASKSDYKPVPKVMWNKKALSTGTDYSVTYYSSADAGITVSGDTVTITDAAVAVIPHDAATYYARIKGKGNYTGEVIKKFTIISSEKVLVSTLSVTAKNKAFNTGNPVTLGAGELVVKDGTKVLSEKTESNPGGEYEVNYANNTDIGVATVTIRGVDAAGKYYGTKTVTFKITGTDIGKAKLFDLASAVDYKRGNPVTQNFYLKNGTVDLNGITVSEYAGKGAAAKRDYDYTYEYRNNVNPGKATLIINGVNGYYGTVTKIFTIKDVPMRNVTITGFNAAVNYTGSALTQNVSLSYKPSRTADAVTVNGISKTEYDALSSTAKLGYDCTIEYANNVNAGTATMILTGVNGYSGVVKKTYKINPYNIVPSADTSDSFKVSLDGSDIYYDKTGAKPEPTVTFNGAPLVIGRDYKITYLNNTAVNDATGNKKPTVKITGVGNYKGDDASTTFVIKPRGLDNGITITAPDVVYAAKKGAWKAAVTLTDASGKKLISGTDYDANISYKYVEIGGTVMDGSGKTPVEVTRTAGDFVEANDIVPAGTKIRVVVSAKANSNYTGTISTGNETDYRVVQADINRLKIIIEAKTFIGGDEPAAITLDKNKDFTFKSGTKTVNDVTFEIVPGTYMNNTKAGTATVVIRGTGNYGGIRKVTFTIGKRGLLWWWNNLKN